MANFFSKVFGFGVGVALVWGVTNTSGAPAPEKIYQRVLPSVMTLVVENQAGERFVGSAVMVLADDAALTAWHVVCDARSVWATFADGTQVEVIGCIDQDGNRDLALIKLGQRLPGRRANLARSLQAVASRAYVIGAPKGYGFSISDGLVSQIRYVDGFPQYQISNPISPGNSGGPVLDARGRLIGIVSWTKSDAQSVSFAIPTREILRLNAAGKVASWRRLSAAARPPLASRWVAADSSVIPAGSDSREVGLQEFKRRFDELSGKRVTVLLQDAGQEEKFTFTVPPRVPTE